MEVSLVLEGEDECRKIQISAYNLKGDDDDEKERQGIELYG